ncbi:MAG: ribonuclease H-like domain-containing protein [Lachnospiraceae bacterium]|nr:ribonuclease H-like domain-containing protein [Lachnospiraceae bacterium]
MEIRRYQIPFTAQDPISWELFTESSIFFDIETTGFSQEYTQVYLIGCGTRQDNTLHITQFFAENSQAEPEILSAFLQMISQYKSLISFHGLRFDIPYIKGRCRHYGIRENLDDFPHLDLFKQFYKCKSILKLPNRKQKTFEAFLGINRKDLYTGRDLIKIYKEYEIHPSPESNSLLFLHNYEDILGMTNLLSLFAYHRLFQGQFQVVSYEQNIYETYNGGQASEFVLTLSLDYAVPKPFSFDMESFYLKGYEKQAKLKIPIFQGELKYFYPNYKDYYYLPEEDRAIHKSIALYVDKAFRTKAKAATCYNRKDGQFLPQQTEIITPGFKMEYQDKTSWFELTEQFLESEDLLKKYAMHILWRLSGIGSL